ncbi:DegQ family serine endoprotease [Halovulum dunhuangense]|uniref:Probable periplasmic serine endoprotease DegP-like n=1 Tax=Halovulum dunhuangense TaxID=1505036 RepID=A0A849L1S1_9RHOB|nr:DegQ family serine endoprotease [Halovulum dunhuangense]NNU80258.1 DegQ family serine endoprotease [Halovulum dunhuangense]
MTRVKTAVRPNTPVDLLRAAFVILLAAAALLAAQVQRLPAQAVPGSFADLAQRLSPAVVNITTTTVIATDQGISPMVPEGSPLEDFFRDFLDRQGPQQRERRGSALGSGFVISADGYIVTNNHVIESADEILVEFFDGLGELPAEVVGTDPRTDIALLKVEPNQPLPFVPFGDSDGARVGDWVLAIGNPLGQGFSVSAGIISARNRSLQGAYDDFIQTDAAINRGNSGGPLFNMAGEVIGVNTAILSPNGGSIGIGFAMSSSVVTRVVDQLKEFGETRRGWLGVSIQNVTPDVAEAMGLDSAAGALVTDVPPGPAMDAGILVGDVILNFAGQDVADTRELVRMVGNTDVGSVARVVVFRDGGTQTLRVTLGRREEAEANYQPGGGGAPDLPQVPETVLGMTLSALTPELRAELGLPEDERGVAITEMDETSEAFDKGLRPGDVIAEIGQQPVSTPQDVAARFSDAAEAGRRSVLMLVRRDGQPRFVALTPQG